MELCKGKGKRIRRELGLSLMGIKDFLRKRKCWLNPRKKKSILKSKKETEVL